MVAPARLSSTSSRCGGRRGGVRIRGYWLLPVWRRCRLAGDLGPGLRARPGEVVGAAGLGRQPLAALEHAKIGRLRRRQAPGAGAPPRGGTIELMTVRPPGIWSTRMSPICVAWSALCLRVTSATIAAGMAGRTMSTLITCSVPASPATLISTLPGSAFWSRAPSAAGAPSAAAAPAPADFDALSF